MAKRNYFEHYGQLPKEGTNMIVKIQDSVFPKSGQIMIYDKKQRFTLIGEVSKKRAYELTGGELKVFANAQVKNGKLDIIGKTDWQDW